MGLWLISLSGGFITDVPELWVYSGCLKFVLFIADVQEWLVYDRCPGVVSLWPMSQSGVFFADVPE